MPDEPLHAIRKAIGCLLVALLVGSHATSRDGFARGVAGAAPLDVNASVRAIDRQQSTLADMVFVTEDIQVDMPGCDAISVLDTEQTAPLFRGPTHISPGRLTSNADFSMLVAGPSQGFAAQGFFYAIHRDGPAWNQWQVQAKIYDTRLAPVGGIALLADGDTLLASTAGKGKDSELPVPPPYGLMRLSLADIRPDGAEWRTGPARATRMLPSIPVEILPTRDGRVIQVLTERGTIYTLDPVTLVDVAPPIVMQPPANSGRFPGRPWADGYVVGQIQATLTADERYLISNRGGGSGLDAAKAGLNVADLTARTTWTLGTSPDVTFAGGIALNKGWVNSGLLALHALDKTIVYRFSANGPLEEQSRYPVANPMAPGGGGGPSPSVAWSGSGERLIMANNVMDSWDPAKIGPDTAEFTILDVRDGGATVDHLRDITVCPPMGGDAPYLVNSPNDILTANGMVTPPTTATASPPPTHTATPTPTTTATPSATQTPRPIYLPALVWEKCTSELRRTDLILVIDASTTMLERTRASRTKIDAAIAAASTLAADLDPGRDRLGLVWFNDAAHMELAPTFDRSEFRAALDRMQVRELTRIDLGIAAAHTALTGVARRGDAAPVLMLLTDGRANPGPEALALNAAAEAKAEGITVFTVGIGDRIDEASLRAMASSSAHYFYAPDGEDLPAAYDGVRSALPCPPAAFWPRAEQRGSTVLRYIASQ